MHLCFLEGKELGLKHSRPCNIPVPSNKSALSALHKVCIQNTIGPVPKPLSWQGSFTNHILMLADARSLCVLLALTCCFWIWGSCIPPQLRPRLSASDTELDTRALPTLATASLSLWRHWRFWLKECHMGNCKRLAKKCILPRCVSSNPGYGNALALRSRPTRPQFARTSTNYISTRVSELKESKSSRFLTKV